MFLFRKNQKLLPLQDYIMMQKTMSLVKSKSQFFLIGLSYARNFSVIRSIDKMIGNDTLATTQIQISFSLTSRSSHRRFSVKKGVLRNFAKFTGKHLGLSLFFNKVAGAACNFIKKEALAQVFSCEFCKKF